MINFGKKFSAKMSLAICLLFLMAFFSNTWSAHALSKSELQSIYSDTVWYRPEGSALSSSCLLATLPEIIDKDAVAEAINKFIISNDGKDSPFEGLGSQIVNGAIKSGVNPFLVTAIAKKESSFGFQIPPGSFNAFGRTAAPGQPSVESNGRNWYKWESWDQSVNGPNDEATLLKNVYIDDGLTEIIDVINKYAPSADSNDPSGYTKQVNEWMADMAAASGSALNCGTVEEGPSNPTGNVALGKQLAADYGWGDGRQWGCLYKLWQSESGWNEKADNPTSDAYGIPQSLPGSKMASEGSDWQTNPATQIKWGLKYIKGRYSTPCNAWAFWQSQDPHWY